MNDGQMLWYVYDVTYSSADGESLVWIGGHPTREAAKTAYDQYCERTKDEGGVYDIRLQTKEDLRTDRSRDRSKE
ncbi:MAG TPA: hypothetical protein VLA04_05140 [Verrucomicrobiae bacterium]|nr:hypothetical protein [Verrucomicrobiae bacterium]